MTQKLGSAAALAKALGITQARVSQMRKFAWFPKPRSGTWDLEEVKSAIKANTKRRNKAPSKGAADPKPAPQPSNFPQSVEPDVEIEWTAPLRVLADAEASALDHARAARQVCAAAFAREAAKANGGFGNSADDLKRALEEQRRAEKAWLDLERQRGRLIQRSAAIRVATELARQAATTMDAIEAQIASQIEVWIGDPEFMNGDALTRQRRVIAFFDRSARRVREANANTVEMAIAQSQGDVAPDLDDEEDES